MLFFYLVVAHFLFDFILQGELIAVNKNRHSNTELQKKVGWAYWMIAHSFVHGGAVAWITNNVWLGMAEVIAHFVIDFFKCEDKYDIHMDQMLHLWCKIAWVGIVVWGMM
jgi:hypothetical protein